jgi:hypothetical protein
MGWLGACDAMLWAGLGPSWQVPPRGWCVSSRPDTHTHPLTLAQTMRRGRTSAARPAAPRGAHAARAAGGGAGGAGGEGARQGGADGAHRAPHALRAAGSGGCHAGGRGGGWGGLSSVCKWGHWTGTGAAGVCRDSAPMQCAPAACPPDMRPGHCRRWRGGCGRPWRSRPGRRRRSQPRRGTRRRRVAAARRPTPTQRRRQRGCAARGRCSLERSWLAPQPPGAGLPMGGGVVCRVARWVWQRAVCCRMRCRASLLACTGPSTTACGLGSAGFLL